MKWGEWKTAFINIFGHAVLLNAPSVLQSLMDEIIKYIDYFMIIYINYIFPLDLALHINHFIRVLMPDSEAMQWLCVSVCAMLMCTSTKDDSSNEERKVTVVQLQGIKLHRKLELWLHNVTEGFPQTPQELPRDKATAIRHQQPILIH